MNTLHVLSLRGNLFQVFVLLGPEVDAGRIHLRTRTNLLELVGLLLGDHVLGLHFGLLVEFAFRSRLQNFVEVAHVNTRDL